VSRAVSSEPGFGPADAVAQADPADVAHFLHPHFDASSGLDLIGMGAPASPGAASGRVVLSADEAIEAAERSEKVILVRTETGPEDVLGMQAAAGILTARGGLASHAAVVARGWGIPAVVGAKDLQVHDGGFTISGHLISSGETVSIDGHTGAVYRGQADVTTAVAPPELDKILAWADQLRAGRFGVRANADDAEAARHARALGADGIGLCRTEHMFLAEDRLPLVRRLILSDDDRVDALALEALEEVQQKDFEALFEAMDGLPVTVRLLDPPLHEFLPPLEPLIVAEATGTLGEEAALELAAVRRLTETNPMIGTRGVRLGTVKPGLYPMQVRAISKAVSALRARGKSPHVEVMIPLVVDAAELQLARRWVEAAERESKAPESGVAPLSVGTMIETPRAAILASEMAGAADFFSFGTNDLTQLTFAFSRDDVEAELIPSYVREGLLADNPFEVLDRAGVGFLISHAVTTARATCPTLPIGACGEQAGDPASARFLVACGLDYVSCSPFRLPVARLSVAQALLELGRVDPSEVFPEHPRSGGSRQSPSANPQAGSGSGTAAEVDPATLLHALRIKGFAPAALVAEMTGTDPDRAIPELSRFESEGLTRYHQARDLWQLTPAGREAHTSWLAGPGRAGPDSIEKVRTAYEKFLALNVGLKELCVSWQLRDGAPNDHSDTGYDQARIAELASHHAGAVEVISEMGAAIPRLGRYLSRLDDALARLSSGTAEAFTGVMKRSYHDVWMELHEDLILILGIDRSAEGSF
jgi:phosphoenolpyruvate-protein kinase (PTS system EI component)